MRDSIRASAFALLPLLMLGSSAYATLPLEVFAAPDAIASAAISPDGHYISEVVQQNDRRFVVVVNRQDKKSKPATILSDSTDGFTIDACRWVSDTRMVCNYRGIIFESAIIGHATRLVAIDADGKNPLVLLRNSQANDSGQFDRVIDWNAGPDTILIEASQSLLDTRTLGSNGAAFGALNTGGIPAVFSLNVVTGQSRVLMQARESIGHYLSDAHGNPRVAWGGRAGSTTEQIYVRDGKNEWRSLTQFSIFTKETPLQPVALDTDDAGRAIATGSYQGHVALWSIDLADKQSPQLLYANAKVDVGPLLVYRDGRVLGVGYDTERPHWHYLDPKLKTLMDSIDAALPDTTTQIVDETADGSLLLVRTTSDSEPGAYFLLNTNGPKLEPLGRANSALDSAQLGRMLAISYPARDGTMIPGYLTKPPAGGDHLPLIVLPHDGPNSRDSWRYSFLGQFLVSRGYAVLQMNFRGSRGYGDAWREAAYRDWGGLPYNDIVDGVQWAIRSGIADPNRIAIAGWGYGGYAALLGASRNSDLFRCAISIAGISDLALRERQGDYYSNGILIRDQIGSDHDKLQATSPQRHAADIKVPLLLIHGDHDDSIYVEQTEAMVEALKRAGKPFDFVKIKDAEHSLERQSDRLALLNAVGPFLDKCNPISGPTTTTVQSSR